MENAYEQATPHSLFGTNNLPSGFWAPFWDPPGPRSSRSSAIPGEPLRNCAPERPCGRRGEKLPEGPMGGAEGPGARSWGDLEHFHRVLPWGPAGSRVILGTLGAPPGVREALRATATGFGNCFARS